MKIELLLHESERNILDYFESKGVLDTVLVRAVNDYIQEPTAQGRHLTWGEQQWRTIMLPEAARKAIIREVGRVGEGRLLHETKKLMLAAIAAYCTRVSPDRLPWPGSVRKAESRTAAPIKLI